MTLRASLGLAFVSLLALGCSRSGNVAAVHPDEPGTHVVSGHGAVSVVRNTGSGSRVCTRLVPGKPGKGPVRAANAGAHLDVLLFRLCEARSNGDISAEQYAATVQSIVKTMEQRAAQPRVAAERPRRFDMQPRRRWRRAPRFDGEPVGPGPEPPPKKDERK